MRKIFSKFLYFSESPNFNPLENFSTFPFCKFSAFSLEVFLNFFSRKFWTILETKYRFIFMTSNTLYVALSIRFSDGKFPLSLCTMGWNHYQHYCYILCSCAFQKTIILFSSSNNQLRIPNFCNEFFVYLYFEYLPGKSFRLLSQYNQKCQYNSLHLVPA